MTRRIWLCPEPNCGMTWRGPPPAAHGLGRWCPGVPVEGVWAPLTEAREGWFHDVLVNDDPDDWGVFPENHDGVHGVPVLVVPAVAATNTEETIQDQLRLEAMYDGHTHAAGNAVDRIDALETALHRVAMTEFTYTKPASMAWAECCKIAREALEAS